MAGYFTGTGTYIEMADNAALDLANTGWIFQAFVYPESALTQQSFGYIYSHATPLATAFAFNVIRTSPGKAVRVIIDWSGGNLLDFTTTTALLVDDTWNTVVVAYNGTNVFIGTGQGTAASMVVETASPPALPNITPAGVARIGYSVAGGSRNFAGRIAQVFKADIGASLTETQILAGTYRSSGFFPVTSAWRIPLQNATAFDEKNVLTVTEVSMSYQPDGPFLFPVRPYNTPPENAPVVAANFGYCYWRRC